MGQAAVGPRLEDELEAQRPALTGYCYRMLGSPFEAEDAVQETMLRAWRSRESFAGRSSRAAWLYRIATNVCLDALSGRERRDRPIDLGPAGTVTDALVASPGEAWIEPMPDGRVAEHGDDPARMAQQRESLRLAFVAALQHLPPRQRAVLILREALRWSAAEVAELLETTVPSVNSALQRARATLDERSLTAAPGGDGSAALDGAHRDLLDRYVAAFESYDMDALIALIHRDAVFSMPPFSLWLRGTESIRAWLTGRGAGCSGSRLVPVEGGVNGCPAFGQYKIDAEHGGHSPWALQVFELADDRIVSWTSFLDTASVFPLCGLPLHLPGPDDEDSTTAM